MRVAAARVLAAMGAAAMAVVREAAVCTVRQ